MSFIAGFLVGVVVTMVMQRFFAFRAIVQERRAQIAKRLRGIATPLTPKAAPKFEERVEAHED